MKNAFRLSALFLACAGAYSTAQAADIQMFGFFDQGISYLHEDLNAGMGGPAGQSLSNPAGIDPAKGHVERQGTKSQLAQGTGNVSTWGIRGSEQLNDDVKFIFHLENGFLADSGEFYIANRLFEREASAGLASNTFGQIKFGRMPALTTGSGTTGIFNSRVNPFGAGWGNMTGGWKFVGTLATARYDNMINYISPKFGGLQFHAQYSFKNNSTAAGEEGSSDADRWWAIGATLTGEKYFLAAAVDCVDYGHRVPTSAAGSQADSMPEKEAYKFLIGGHYNFDAFKLYGAAQYMKNVPWIGGYSTKEVAPMLSSDISPVGEPGSVKQRGFDAWALSTGVDFKQWGGTVKLSVGYAQAENQNISDNNDMQRANVGLGYVYPLSKRTSIYGIAGAFWQDADWQEDDITAHEAIVGLMHRF